MALPVSGVAYSFYTALTAQSNPDTFQANPTIAAGDFQVSIDGGAFANLATLPTVGPAGSIMVLISLSAAEMTGSNINVFAQDQAGAEWSEAVFPIEAPVGSVESLVNLAFGDRVESKTSLVVNLRGTTTAVLAKTITGSLLTDSVTIGTTDT